MESCIIETPLGFTQITGDDLGIASIHILDSDEKLTDVIPECLQDCVYQLNEYFEGSRKQFDLTLNPEGTVFQKTVWDALEKIPYGKTVSYLELSKKIGDVKAIRAVANANGKNPLWIVIPCHRVIGTDGSLTGYAGGLHRKKWLLDHENPYKQQSLF
ncbi:methylated-DNA--[protein]-cysteine S-methyltransferase [Bizionia myxarmorum]|uniref:Methylated-DNA--protein-cysteine methyltransferase n=1 Tax=Bizionia myxarmorum TaxID=291186 RepID=A0A5D0RG67_9FLAO|nr:methylated-DNA--[protein]-cysteine S-methyltransferase [Bizionia myxarmorum]TYB79901.1 methylated-DNA--[protein]-cysteine S-methyltransferase [Bizionia myxarmorum]